MQIEKATEANRNELIALLRSNNLPTEDLPPSLNDFFIVKEDDKVIGAIGMERYSHYGLLRSMVVHPQYRNRRIAERLVDELEEKAISSNITALLLLTETAKEFFFRKGYNVITRDEVPTEVKASSEFSLV